MSNLSPENNQPGSVRERIRTRCKYPDTISKVNRDRGDNTSEDPSHTPRRPKKVDTQREGLWVPSVVGCGDVRLGTPVRH